jgi:hypothetical protein
MSKGCEKGFYGLLQFWRVVEKVMENIIRDNGDSLIMYCTMAGSRDSNWAVKRWKTHTIGAK